MVDVLIPRLNTVWSLKPTALFKELEDTKTQIASHFTGNDAEDPFIVIVHGYLDSFGLIHKSNNMDVKEIIWEGWSIDKNKYVIYRTSMNSLNKFMGEVECEDTPLIDEILNSLGVCYAQ